MPSNTQAAGDVPPRPKRSIPQASQLAADKLASEIAEAFRDPGHLPIYQVYCRNFPLEVIRQAYAEVRSVEEHRVKRSRLALFIFLVKKYAKEKEQHTGN